MSGASTIEWTDATWNPVRGCSRVSEGCRHCYAETLAARNLPGHRSPTTGKPFAERTLAGPRWTGKVELIPHLLDWPLRRKKPMRIFVNSMSDLFHEGLSDAAIGAVFGVMAAARQHTFQVLTKRPRRALEWFQWAAAGTRGRFGGPALAEHAACCFEEGGDRKSADLLFGCANKAAGLGFPLPNVWLGVSVENQATADERIPLLLQTPAAVRFVSYEPALGPVNFRPWLTCPRDTDGDGNCGQRQCPFCSGQRGHGAVLDWLIVGGESGPDARSFNAAWARSTVRQCRDSNVACFVKQLGSGSMMHTADGNGRHVRDTDSERYVVFRDRKGGDPSEWPEDLRVREFPR